MSTDMDMNLERFTALVEAYGADPARWPAEERDAALAYKDAHPTDAALVLAPESALDSTLDTAREAAPDTSFLAARILKAAQDADHEKEAFEAPANEHISGPAHLPRARWKSIAATFIITTGMGFAAGQSAAAKSARIAEAETLLSLTLDNPYDSSGMWEDS